MAAMSSARVIVVDLAHSRASDKNLGSEKLPLKTISAAAGIAQPGDTVLVHAGIYRERVAPARGGEDGNPIVYAAAKGEDVFLRGSEVHKGKWTPVDPGANIWRTELDSELFPAVNPYRTRLKGRRAGGDLTPLPGGAEPNIGTLGQVFVDGRPLWESVTDRELRSVDGSWMVNESGDALIVRFPARIPGPAKHLIESAFATASLPR